MTLHLINKNIHKMYDWLYDISESLDTDDLDICLAVLRAVLHKVRDHLPVINAAHLSEQLPTIIRGIFFEAWDPQNVPIKERSKEEFLYSVRVSLAAHPDIEEEQAVSAVLGVLYRKVAPGALNKIMAVVPKGVRIFFQEIYSV